MRKDKGYIAYDFYFILAMYLDGEMEIYSKKVYIFFIILNLSKVKL